MSLNPTATLYGAPTPTRGLPLHVSTDDSGKWIAYPSGQLVILRDVTNLAAPALVCARHTVPVTCCRLSSMAAMCASGDRDGNVIVWANKADMIVVYQGKLIGGPVRDIAWSEDQERIVCVGEGKTMAAVIAVNGGNSVGTIMGHQRTIVSCDFKRSRPFRISTGAQDTQVNFYEGPPFKFTHSVAGLNHQGNVNAVRFSPDSSTLATASGSADLWLLDAKTGDKLRSIATGHTGSIYALAWSKDSATIVTASADKTVKLFNAVDGSLLRSFTFGTSPGHMQLGVAWTSIGVVSLGLNGDINVLPSTGGAAEAQVYRGHQRLVGCVAYDAISGRTISASGDGRVLAWTDPNVAGGAALSGGGAHEALGAMSFAPASGELVATAGEDNIVSYNVAMAVVAAPVAIAALNGTAAAVVAVYKASCAVFAGGKKVWEDKYGNAFDGTCVAAQGHTFVVGGDKAARVYEFNVATGQAEPRAVLQGRHTTTVTAVAISHSGDRVATGDASHVIAVWDAATGTILVNDLVFHRSKVTALAFAPHSSSDLVSGSVDCAVIVWQLSTANGGSERHVIRQGAHANGVTAVAFGASPLEVVSGGGDGSVRRWALAAA